MRVLPIACILLASPLKQMNPCYNACCIERRKAIQLFPDAIANPYASGGNGIVRAFVALLFCGIALVIATTNGSNKKQMKRQLPNA
jgi:hypothetical protein